MSNIYYLIGAVVYGIFFVQFILSWFGGDTDMDVDFDGNVDMDVSDFVSFKGFIHFLMGSTGWLCVKESVSGNVQWYDYLIALFLGIVFVVILYYLYKFCLKLQHQVVPETGQALVGKIGIVYLVSDCYYLTVEINGRTDTIGAHPEDSSATFTKGEDVLITKFENGKYYFQ